jgi:hypothetical protein
MELFQLNEHNRNASLGYDYHELLMNYPNWSYDLHVKGNVIDNDKLKQIANEGIIYWYLQNEVPYNLHFEYSKRINSICENIREVSYYDFLILVVKLNKLPATKLNNSIEETKFKFLTKYFKCGRVKNTKFEKYCVNKFYLFLLEELFNNSEDNMKEYFLSIKTEIDEIPILRSRIMYGLFEKYPEIELWGIIFQKFKVILEKIPDYKKYVDKIYKIDRFVDMIQQHIYSAVKYYCLSEEKIDTRTEFTNFLQNPRLLEKYSLEDTNLDWIFEDSFFVNL